MRALHRCGRRADALDVFHRARQVLVDELGIEPGAQLCELQRSILTEEAPNSDPIAPAGQPARPAQLPGDVRGFTGRAAQLAWLDGMLPSEADPQANAVVISALEGSAGVGKTALAVHWGHRIQDRFDGGQLYVNLRGYAEGPPLRPIDALARFLRALGVPNEQVPSDVDEAATWYRSLLADKRVLVLLDNAGHPDQVRPLLPASPACLALITSRNRLAGLVARDGATALTLDVLTPDESHALLGRLLGVERTTAEPTAAADLAHLCGHLPLALRIVAANLSEHPGTTLADHAAQLHRSRLDSLTIDGDPSGSVRTTFGYSYANLRAPARQVFRLLGLVPGPDITAPAAAALAGTDLDDVTIWLDRLAAAHLVDEHTPGRYALHDLLSQYAAELATAEDSEHDRAAALDRWYRHYLDSVDAAANLLYPEITRLPSPTATTAVDFTDHAGALAWLEAERANAVAAVRHAAARGRHRVAWQLADALRGYLYLRLHAADWETVARVGLTAAEAGRDPQARAAAHLNRATLEIARGRSRQAIEEYQPAFVLARQARWVEGEAAALGGLGAAHAELGQLERAAECHEQALAIDRATGLASSQAIRLGNLGQVQWILGRLEPAAEQYAEALALHRRAGSPTGQAWALECLGGIQHELGHLDQARESLTQALAMYEETGHHGQAGTVRALAEVHRDAGRLDQAIDLADRALAFARDDGDRRNEADALATRASVRSRLDDHPRAIDDYQQAVSRARDIPNQYIEAHALTGLADTHRRTGHLDAAADTAAAALAITGQVGYRSLDGRARTVLAAVRLDQGRPEQALDQASQALRTHTATGNRLGQAHTHLIAAAAHGQTGNHSQAHHHRRCAHALFEQTGAVPP
jgi:tetratricopeptide (TPR) repeat protein